MTNHHLRFAAGDLENHQSFNSKNLKDFEKKGKKKYTTRNYTVPALQVINSIAKNHQISTQWSPTFF